MDPTVAWTALSSIAGVAAVAVAGWQVRIGIADHRLRQAAARREDKISTAGVPRRSEHSRRPVRLPPRAEVLAGREDLLAELHARLSDGPEPRTVALCGLGGAGKTSLAVEYAHRHLGEVLVCWQLPAEDPMLLEAEFAVLAAELGSRGPGDTRDPVASTHAVLAQQETGWLLIFDNAPDLASVERFLPPAGRGRVLVTTQSQHWPPGQTAEVPVLTANAAVGFLTSQTGSTDHNSAAELAKELGGLPLALAQAAAYIRATGMSMKEYLRLFRARQADLLTRGDAEGHPSHVAATLELALSELGEQSSAALGLMRLLAFLAPDPVPLGLLLGDAHFTDSTNASVPDEIASLIGDPVALGDAIAALRRYSLVTSAEDSTVLVHRLVRAVTRTSLSTENCERWRQAAAIVVKEAIPANTEIPAAFPMCALLLPHVRATMSPVDDGMSRIAEYLIASGSHPAAVELWQQIANAYAEHEDYGPKHPGVFQARINLIYSATRETGDYRSARDRYADLLSAAEQALGPEHPYTLRTRDMLAFFTYSTGDFEGGRTQGASLVPVLERVLGPEHPDTLVARMHLAAYIGTAGNPTKACRQCADLLPGLERSLGSGHPYTLLTRIHLAAFTGGAGNPGNARDQYADMLPVVEQALGTEHPYTLRARSNHILTIADAGDVDSACAQYADLFPVLERAHGTGNPMTLMYRNNLAVFIALAGDLGSAREHWVQALSLHERALGPDARDTFIIRGNLTTWAGEESDTPGKFRAIYQPIIYAQMIRLYTESTDASTAWRQQQTH